MERRLAAILAADVVGYSRLMGADEVGTLARLKALRRELVQPKIIERKGRIFKLMGDGLLAEFPSVVEAVQCAFDIQQSMAGREVDVPDEHRIRLRIGVNLGDIIVEGSDIYGDGVNVVARLEQLAGPGEVCLSGDAYRQVRGKIDAQFEDLGERELKNVTEAVRVYRIASERPSSSGASSALQPLRLHDKPTVAVLPFVNISADPEQEYFSDGLTEDLITELSRFKELSVVSRNSTFVFKGKAESLRKVGEMLTAQYLVEGSVRRAGDRIRVSAQLIDAQDDKHIWAERYDRGMEDIFQVQDELVRRVASTLVDRLEYDGQSRAKRQSKDQLRAYDLYLRAREHFFNWSIRDNISARDYLRSALAIEPDYAAALALLSEVLLRMWLNGWSEDPEEDLAESFAVAKRADELDDQDSRTQTALGMAYLFQKKLVKAKHHFESALKLNPNDTRVLVYYSRHAVFDGDHTKAVDLCRQALTLNPYGKYNWNLGLAYFVAHQYEAAIESLERIRNPTEAVLALLAASYAMADRMADVSPAFARYAEAVGTSPVMSKLDRQDEWRDYLSARWPFRDPKDLDHLLSALKKAGLPL
ncbi:MAG TPA: adenylate/guanylate cyclase domain-containing protein [Kiloniellales bacterium]